MVCVLCRVRREQSDYKAFLGGVVSHLVVCVVQTIPPWLRVLIVVIAVLLVVLACSVPYKEFTFYNVLIPAWGALLFTLGLQTLAFEGPDSGLTIEERGRSVSPPSVRFLTTVGVYETCSCFCCVCQLVGKLVCQLQRVGLLCVRLYLCLCRRLAAVLISFSMWSNFARLCANARFRKTRRLIPELECSIPPILEVQPLAAMDQKLQMPQQVMAAFHGPSGRRIHTRCASIAVSSASKSSAWWPRGSTKQTQKKTAEQQNSDSIEDGSIPE